MGNLSALGNTVVQTTPVGVIEAFAGINVPAGWLFCDGSAVSRVQYPELFSALSTTYGSGDGSTTFNLPDMRGRVPAGRDNMGGVAANRLTSGNSGITATSLGANGGDERLHQHTHIQNAHSHPPYPGYEGFWQEDSQSGVIIAQGGNFKANSLVPSTGNTTATNQNAGSGNSQNVQPTLIVNYIIKAVADLPRGGWFYQNNPPVVTSLPSNPQIGEQVIRQQGTTGAQATFRYDGSAWRCLSGSLVLLDSRSHSSVSSYDYNNIFTSDFKNYRIVVRNVTASATTALGFRLRTGSSTISTSTYIVGGAYVLHGGGGANISNAADVAWYLVWATNDGRVAAASHDILSPALATRTNYVGEGANYDAGLWITGQQTGATSYDGFNLYATTGGSTFSAIVNVYGYTDA